MRFDHRTVRVPLMDEVSDEEYRRMTDGQRIEHIFAINQQVREAHARYFREQNPWAMPADILLDWMRRTGVDKLVPPDLLAYNTTDTPIIVISRASELEKAGTPNGTDHATR